MQSTLKILSLLLSYPIEDLQSAVPDIRVALEQDQQTGDTEKSGLIELAENIAELDLLDAQERYVYLFDRTRSLSLHLFEHVHGESRDRGQAMVELMNMYESHGLEIDARELPDYLPLFLEYLSTRPVDEIRELVAQASPIVAALAARLQKRDSIYAKAFNVLCAISAKVPDQKELADLLAVAEDDPSDLDALDNIWSEEAVKFGGNAKDEQRISLDQLRHELKSGAQQQGPHDNTSPIQER